MLGTAQSGNKGGLRAHPSAGGAALTTAAGGPSAAGGGGDGSSAAGLSLRDRALKIYKKMNGVRRPPSARSTGRVELVCYNELTGITMSVGMRLLRTQIQNSLTAADCSCLALWSSELIINFAESVRVYDEADTPARADLQPGSVRTKKKGIPSDPEKPQYNEGEWRSFVEREFSGAMVETKKDIEAVSNGHLGAEEARVFRRIRSFHSLQSSINNNKPGSVETESPLGASPLLTPIKSPSGSQFDMSSGSDALVDLGNSSRNLLAIMGLDKTAGAKGEGLAPLDADALYHLDNVACDTAIPHDDTPRASSNPTSPSASSTSLSAPNAAATGSGGLAAPAAQPTGGSCRNLLALVGQSSGGGKQMGFIPPSKKTGFKPPPLERSPSAASSSSGGSSTTLLGGMRGGSGAGRSPGPRPGMLKRTKGVGSSGSLTFPAPSSLSPSSPVLAPSPPARTQTVAAGDAPTATLTAPFLTTTSGGDLKKLSKKAKKAEAKRLKELEKSRKEQEKEQEKSRKKAEKQAKIDAKISAKRAKDQEKRAKEAKAIASIGTAGTRKGEASSSSRRRTVIAADTMVVAAAAANAPGMWAPSGGISMASPSLRSVTTPDETNGSPTAIITKSTVGSKARPPLRRTKPKGGSGITRGPSSNGFKRESSTPELPFLPGASPSPGLDLKMPLGGVGAAFSAGSLVGSALAAVSASNTFKANRKVGMNRRSSASSQRPRSLPHSSGSGNSIHGNRRVVGRTSSSSNLPIPTISAPLGPISTTPTVGLPVVTVAPSATVPGTSCPSGTRRSLGGEGGAGNERSRSASAFRGVEKQDFTEMLTAFSQLNAAAQRTHRAVGETNVGRRRAQEDRLLMMPYLSEMRRIAGGAGASPESVPSGKSLGEDCACSTMGETCGSLAIYGVFDGHRGKNASHFAAQQLPVALLDIMGNGLQEPDLLDLDHIATEAEKAASNNKGSDHIIGGSKADRERILAKEEEERKTQISKDKAPSAEANPNYKVPQLPILKKRGSSGGIVATLGESEVADTGHARALSAAVKRTGRSFSKKAKANHWTDGTTALVALVDDHRRVLTLANLGDCRAVLCSNGAAVTLTRDHRPSSPREAARVKEAGGAVLFWQGKVRVNGVLNVSRAIGDVDLVPAVIHSPEVSSHPLRPEDQFVILATDGLWDAVGAQEAVDIVSKALAKAKRSGKRSLSPDATSVVPFNSSSSATAGGPSTPTAAANGMTTTISVDGPVSGVAVPLLGGEKSLRSVRKLHRSESSNPSSSSGSVTTNGSLSEVMLHETSGSGPHVDPKNLASSGTQCGSRRGSIERSSGSKKNPGALNTDIPLSQLSRIPKTLIKTALSRNSRDNVSVVVIML